MKDIVNAIYKEVYSQSEEASLCDKKLTEEIKDIINLMETGTNDNKLSNYLFEASGDGQKLGFISGFKLAVCLMCECL